MTRGTARDAVIVKAQRVTWENGRNERCVYCHASPVDSTSGVCPDCEKRLKARDDFYKFIFRRRDLYVS